MLFKRYNYPLTIMRLASMDFIQSSILFLVSAAVVCFIYRKHDSSDVPNFDEYLNRLHLLIRSTELSSKHILVHFNVLGHFIKNEIINNNIFTDPKTAKKIVELTWNEYKKSNYYEILKEGFYGKKIKNAFINEVYSITVGTEIENPEYMDLISTELRSFFYTLDLIKNIKYLDNSALVHELPLSKKLYKMSPESLSFIYNFINVVSCKVCIDMDIPLDVLILEWAGKKIKNKEVRNLHIVPRLHLVTNAVPGSKERDIAVCTRKGALTVKTPMVLDAVLTTIESWKNTGIEHDYLKAISGESPHKAIRYDSDEWDKIINSSLYIFNNFKIDLSNVQK